jgi:hypothetical protein
MDHLEIRLTNIHSCKNAGNVIATYTLHRQSTAPRDPGRVRIGKSYRIIHSVSVKYQCEECGSLLVPTESNKIPVHNHDYVLELMMNYSRTYLNESLGENSCYYPKDSSKTKRYQWLDNSLMLVARKGDRESSSMSQYFNIEDDSRYFLVKENVNEPPLFIDRQSEVREHCEKHRAEYEKTRNKLNDSGKTKELKKLHSEWGLKEREEKSFVFKGKRAQKVKLARGMTMLTDRLVLERYPAPELAKDAIPAKKIFVLTNTLKLVPVWVPKDSITLIEPKNK